MPQPPFHPDSPDSTLKRRLLSPQERFGETESNAQDNLENDPFMREIVPEETFSQDPFAELPKTGGGLQKTLPRHEKKKFQRSHAKGAAKHEVKHFERHALPGHEIPKRQSSPRQAARRQKVRRFAGRMLILGALFFAVQLGIAAFSAPQFNVKSVQIEGLNDTPEGAAFPIAQKLRGQNIFRANGVVVQKSLALLPTVKEVRVRRAWAFPPKMRVIVTERTPLAKVGSGRDWWVVDESGVPFRRADKPADAELYALTAPQFDPQTQKTLPREEWKKAREVLLALRSDNAQKSAKWELRRVYLDKNGLASLRLSDKTHPELLVRLGDDDFARKLERARESLGYLAKTGRVADELNLISYDFPRWKPKSQPQGETPALARESESRENRSVG